MIAEPTQGARAAPPLRGTVTCRTCRYFACAEGEIEAGLPGLQSLGSGYGSVRAADGLCQLHDRYLAAPSRCPSHEARALPGSRR